MFGKKEVVSTKVDTDTKTSVKPDGTIVKVISTTTTNLNDDGSVTSITRVETLTGTIKKVPLPPEKSVSVLGIDLNESKAPRAELTTDDNFIRECVEAHNEFRAKHNAGPLVLNRELCKIAQARANHNAAQERMQHSDYEPPRYGENIYYRESQRVDSRRPVEAWYSENSKFDWNRLEGQTGTGHFTQLIWKGSKEVGIAKATSPHGFTYVVANYNPPGNFVGKYQDNVSNVTKKKNTLSICNIL